MIGSARILDRRLSHYSGPRRDPARGAFLSVVRATVERLLGKRRRARAKVLPAIVFVLAILPAVFLVTAAVISGPDDVTSRDAISAIYARYLSLITLPIVLFTALVAPEALAPDRRFGLLGQYLAGPMTPLRYLGAKVVAVASVLWLLALGPLLILLVGLTGLNYGPDGVGAWLLTAGRILLTSGVLALVLTALSLAIASLSERSGMGSALIAFVLLGSAIAAGIARGDREGGSWVTVINLLDTLGELSLRIFATPARCAGDGCLALQFPDLSTTVLVAGLATWFIASIALLVARYLRIEAR